MRSFKKKSPVWGIKKVFFYWKFPEISAQFLKCKFLPQFSLNFSLYFLSEYTYNVLFIIFRCILFLHVFFLGIFLLLFSFNIFQISSSGIFNFLSFWHFFLWYFAAIIFGIFPFLKITFFFIIPSFFHTKLSPLIFFLICPQLF